MIAVCRGLWVPALLWGSGGRSPAQHSPLAEQGGGGGGSRVRSHASLQSLGVREPDPRPLLLLMFVTKK